MTIVETCDRCGAEIDADDVTRINHDAEQGDPTGMALAIGFPLDLCPWCIGSLLRWMTEREAADRQPQEVAGP